MKRIIVDNISKRFKIGFQQNQSALARAISLISGREPKRVITALEGVSFTVSAGETVGIIGENGSGKSTLLRIIAGIHRKDSGQVNISGKVISLIGLGYDMKERLTLEDNVFLVGSLYNMSRKGIREKFNSIVEFAGLEDFVKTKIYQLSLGLSERLVFSIATHCDPEILLLDEVFAVGDESFRHKSAEKIKELVNSGAAVILVSHELWMIEQYCDRAIWLDNGQIISVGNSKEITKKYIENTKNIKNE